MTRRGLFALLSSVALDPERLLWVPGKKLISIPAPLKPISIPVPLKLIQSVLLDVYCASGSTELFVDGKLHSTLMWAGESPARRMLDFPLDAVIAGRKVELKVSEGATLHGIQGLFAVWDSSGRKLT